MHFEKMFYEARPFLYGSIAMYSLANNDNRLMLICGLVLAFCSASVFYMRLNYRTHGQSPDRFN